MCHKSVMNRAVRVQLYREMHAYIKQPAANLRKKMVSFFHNEFAQLCVHKSIDVDLDSFSQ